MDLDLASVFVSLLLTWGIGLLPPVLIRYAIVRRPVEKWAAIAICAGFWLCNVFLFTALGSQSKTHTALFLVAFVSYWILRKRSKQSTTVPRVFRSRRVLYADRVADLRRATKWPLVLTIVSLVLILLFPPYTEHFLNSRGASISGHGGWAFIFSIGRYNTSSEAETINIALWLFELAIVSGIGFLIWRGINGRRSIGGEGT